MHGFIGYHVAKVDRQMKARLRARFFIVFAGFALAVIAAAALIASRLIGREVAQEIESSLRLDLQAAESSVAGLAEELKLVLSVLGGGRRVARGYAEPGSTAAVAELEAIRREIGLDIFLLADGSGTVVLRSSAPYLKGDRLTDAVVTAALAGEPATEFVRFPGEQIRRESTEAARRLDPNASSASLPTAPALLVAAPARDLHGAVIGAVVGGVILRASPLVRARLLALGGSHGGEDGRGSTFSIVADGEIVLTTAVPGAATRERTDAVLSEAGEGVGRRAGRPSLPLARRCLITSSPLLAREGSAVAALVVCPPAEQFTQLRRSLVTLYGGLGLATFAVATAVAWRLAGRISRPIRHLAHAAGKVAEGDFEVRLPPLRARDELGELVASFNAMAAALADHESRLAATQRDLEAANATLRQLNHGYLSMLGFVSHELKNVLGTISWSAHAIDDGLVGVMAPAQANLVHSIRRSIDAALAMSRNYLDLARIEDGQLLVSPRPCELCRDVVEPVVEEMRAEAERHSMTVALDGEAEVGAVADAVMAQVVVRNLLGNAFQYGRRGGCVRVCCRRGGGEALCEVWNEGEGLTPEQTAFAFERFQRFAPASGEAPRGSGLGLFVSREIARRHGGDITVESVPGEWIRFSLHLPAPGDGGPQAVAGTAVS
jgi:signal transduction histidine kinase